MDDWRSVPRPVEDAGALAALSDAVKLYEAYIAYSAIYQVSDPEAEDAISPLGETPLETPLGISIQPSPMGISFYRRV